MIRKNKTAWIIALVVISASLPGGGEFARAGDKLGARSESNSIESRRAVSRQGEALEPTTAGSAAQGYGVNRLVVSSGGSSTLPLTNTGAAFTINQTAAGKSTGQSYGMELGFWYAVSACPISVTGDVQQSGDVNLTDVVYLVNYVLKAGPEPYPCAAAGDVNCSGGVNSTDIIYVVNYVLRAGPAPCNACSLVPWTWSCP